MKRTKVLYSIKYSWVAGLQTIKLYPPKIISPIYMKYLYISFHWLLISSISLTPLSVFPLSPLLSLSWFSEVNADNDSTSEERSDDESDNVMLQTNSSASDGKNTQSNNNTLHTKVEHYCFQISITVEPPIKDPLSRHNRNSLSIMDTLQAPKFSFTQGI